MEIIPNFDVNYSILCQLDNQLITILFTELRWSLNIERCSVYLRKNPQWEVKGGAKIKIKTLM
jgi:hypothetical protein